MQDNIIEEIKSRLDIVDVIGEYVNLKKVGANYSALCPFHSEKNPSFFVSPSKQIWHCFGACSEGGDIFKFIMKIEGVEFGDALRILARKAGVELKSKDPKLASLRSNLFEINELALEFFKQNLWEGSEGKKALDYLLERGLTKESIEAWNLGFAPFEEKKLSDFLISRGFLPKDIAKVGLLVFENPQDPSSYKDRFRCRIIFPIFNVSGQVIGFGGRILKEDSLAPKYLNIPNTLLYDKSKVLYGIDKAKLAMVKEDFCIIVEGYLDVILAWQTGTQNVVATSGTALSENHLEIIKRYTQNLVFALDSDLAGKKATKRGINLAQLQDFKVKVALLPFEKDPADLAKENPQAWRESIEKAKEVIEFVLASALQEVENQENLTPEEKVKVCEEVLPYIKRVQNKIIKEHWIKELAKILKVSEESIREEFAKIKLEEISGEPLEKEKAKVKESKVQHRKEALEQLILTFLIQNPLSLKEFDLEYKESLFTPQIFNLLKKLVSALKESKEIKEASILSILNPQERELVSSILLRFEVKGGKIKKEDFQKALLELEKEKVKEEIEKIKEKINILEREDPNSPALEELLTQLKELSLKLSKLNS